RNDDFLRLGARAPAVARTGDDGAAVRRTGKLARRPPNLLGARRGRSGARLRAPRELSAPRPHGTPDDGEADRGQGRRRGDDESPARPQRVPELACRRRHSRAHTRADSTAARSDRGWRWQFPAARSRLARSVSDRRTTAAWQTGG